MVSRNVLYAKKARMIDIDEFEKICYNNNIKSITEEEDKIGQVKLLHKNMINKTAHEELKKMIDIAPQVGQ